MSNTSQTTAVGLLLLVIAIVSSLYRFGERENEVYSDSDSDVYLHMAGVYAGEISPDAERPLPMRLQHYNRPMLPWLAGQLSHVVSGLSLRGAFSVVNICMSWATACVLCFMLRNRAPQLRHAWGPSVLFLISFPQLNWGYHILTDTSGYFFGFGSLALALAVAEPRVTGQERCRFGLRFALLLSVLFFWQAAGSAARETVYIAIAAAGGMAVLRLGQRDRRWVGWAVATTAMILAKFPHWLWARAGGLHSPSLRLDTVLQFDVAYLLDSIVKSGFTFHLIWIFALLGAWRTRLRGVPAWVWLWAFGGVLYAAAGYCHNNLRHGFPLRLLFPIFPVVFFLATRFWETLPRIRRPGVAVAGMAAAYAGAGLALMMLDEGRARITIYNLNVETLPWQAMGAVGLGMALFAVGVAAAFFLRPGHTQAAQAPR